MKRRANSRTLANKKAKKNTKPDFDDFDEEKKVIEDVLEKEEEKEENEEEEKEEEEEEEEEKEKEEEEEEEEVMEEIKKQKKKTNIKVVREKKQKAKEAEKGDETNEAEKTKKRKKRDSIEKKEKKEGDTMNSLSIRSDEFKQKVLEGYKNEDESGKIDNLKDMIRLNGKTVMLLNGFNEQVKENIFFFEKGSVASLYGYMLKVKYLDLLKKKIETRSYIKKKFSEFDAIWVLFVEDQIGCDPSMEPLKTHADIKEMFAEIYNRNGTFVYQKKIVDQKKAKEDYVAMLREKFGKLVQNNAKYYSLIAGLTTLYDLIYDFLYKKEKMRLLYSQIISLFLFIEFSDSFYYSGFMTDNVDLRRLDKINYGQFNDEVMCKSVALFSKFYKNQIRKKKLVAKNLHPFKIVEYVYIIDFEDIPDKAIQYVKDIYQNSYLLCDAVIETPSIELDIKYINENWRKKDASDRQVGKTTIISTLNTNRKTFNKKPLDKEQTKAIEKYLKSFKLVEPSGKRWNLVVKENSDLQKYLVKHGIRPYGRIGFDSLIDTTKVLPMNNNIRSPVSAEPSELLETMKAIAENTAQIHKVNDDLQEIKTLMQQLLQILKDKDDGKILQRFSK